MACIYGKQFSRHDNTVQTDYNAFVAQHPNFKDESDEQIRDWVFEENYLDTSSLLAKLLGKEPKEVKKKSSSPYPHRYEVKGKIYGKIKTYYCDYNPKVCGKPQNLDLYTFKDYLTNVHWTSNEIIRVKDTQNGEILFEKK